MRNRNERALIRAARVIATSSIEGHGVNPATAVSNSLDSDWERFKTLINELEARLKILNQTYFGDTVTTVTQCIQDTVKIVGKDEASGTSYRSLVPLPIALPGEGFELSSTVNRLIRLRAFPRDAMAPELQKTLNAHRAMLQSEGRLNPTARKLIVDTGSATRVALEIHERTLSAAIGYAVLLSTNSVTTDDNVNPVTTMIRLSSFAGGPTADLEGQQRKHVREALIVVSKWFEMLSDVPELRAKTPDERATITAGFIAEVITEVAESSSGRDLH